MSRSPFAGRAGASPGPPLIDRVLQPFAEFAHTASAKLGILAASLAAGICGWILLRRAGT
jgi:Na+/H+ antiporter NhaA